MAAMAQDKSDGDRAIERSLSSDLLKNRAVVRAFNLYVNLSHAWFVTYG